MSISAKQLIEEAKSKVESVSPEQAQEGLILDVREPGELTSEGQVDGAIHIPRGTLEMKADEHTAAGEARLLEARRAGSTVHVLCASGARAALAAATLKQMGYTATVIEGGMGAWKKAGLPVSKPG